MTDLIKRAKAALEEHKKWFDVCGNFLGGKGDSTPLELMAPDLARLAVAAGELAEQVQRVKDFRYDPNIGIEMNRLEDALARFRAIAEDKTDG